MAACAISNITTSGWSREALRERERLVQAAPHIIRPMRFVLPHENAVRPWWMVRLGLYLYDLLGGQDDRCRARAACARRDTAYTAPLKGGDSGLRLFGRLRSTIRG